MCPVLLIRILSTYKHSVCVCLVLVLLLTSVHVCTQLYQPIHVIWPRIFICHDRINFCCVSSPKYRVPVWETACCQVRGYSFSRRPCRLVFWSVLLVSLFYSLYTQCVSDYSISLPGKSRTDPSQVPNFCLTGDSCLPAGSPVGFPGKSAVLLLLMNHIGFIVLTSESWLSTLVLMMLEAIIIVILCCGRLACVSWDVSGSRFLPTGCW